MTALPQKLSLSKTKFCKLKEWTMKMKEVKLREWTRKIKEWNQKMKDWTMKSYLLIENYITYRIIPPLTTMTEDPIIAPWAVAT